MTDAFRETMVSVARALYRWDGWNTLPWGPKQVLQGLIPDVIEVDRERSSSSKMPTTAPVDKPKKHLPVPWTTDNDSQ